MKSSKMSKGSLPVRQSGFTLVEIAIVLVIIGLLLGGVLKGQELIENAKVKNTVKDIQGVSSAYFGYIDRFKRLPGDDGPNLAALTSRGGSWANVTLFGNNNGVLLITQAQVFTGAGEGAAFWQHLKAAGLIAGNPSDAAVASLPRNAFNGLIGVGSGITGSVGTAVCLSEVPGKAARAIDTQLDDGVTDSGTIRVTDDVTAAGPQAPGAAVAAATGYSENNTYTLCSTL